MAQETRIYRADLQNLETIVLKDIFSKIAAGDFILSASPQALYDERGHLQVELKSSPTDDDLTTIQSIVLGQTVFQNSQGVQEKIKLAIDTKSGESFQFGANIPPDTLGTLPFIPKFKVECLDRIALEKGQPNRLEMLQAALKL